MFVMYYIYVLYSAEADKYYVGYTSDPQRRLTEHNTADRTTFTSNYRPWQMAALFACGPQEKDAMRLERFIKQQKSRALIEKLVDPDFVPTGQLAQLVRVPHVRD